MTFLNSSLISLPNSKRSGWYHCSLSDITVSSFSEPDRIFHLHPQPLPVDSLFIRIPFFGLFNLEEILCSLRNIKSWHGLSRACTSTCCPISTSLDSPISLSDSPVTLLASSLFQSSWSVLRKFVWLMVSFQFLIFHSLVSIINTSSSMNPYFSQWTLSFLDEFDVE